MSQEQQSNLPGLIEATYACQRAPNFQWDSGAGIVKFVNGRCVLNDAATIQALDTALGLIGNSPRPDLCQLIRRVDRSAAEALVRAHQAEMQRQNGAANGTMTSSHIVASMRKAQEEHRDVQIAAATNNPEAAAAFTKEISNADLLLTSQAVNEVVRSTGEDFIPDKPAAPAAPAPAVEPAAKPNPFPAVKPAAKK
jgi:hypothetical protein